MHLTDEELIQELTARLAQSRKAFSDLTVVNRKLMEMNRRLEESEALKTNFLSNIRNEIINPLNAILGLSAELASGGALAGEVPGIAAMIGAEAASLDFQLRNIFTAAELEAGTLSPHVIEVDIAELISDAVASLQRVALRKSVAVDLRLPDTATPGFPTDAAQLRLIVTNLLANAIEYSESGGTVMVSASLDDTGELAVAVSDTGIGIAPADVARIFDRFVQLDTGTTRSHLGHGLGLSICRALAELLGGRITVDSTPGGGTTFTVLLPAAVGGNNAEEMFAEGDSVLLFDQSGVK